MSAQALTDHENTMKTPSYRNKTKTLYELPTFYKNSLLDEEHQGKKTGVEMVTTAHAPGEEPVTKCGRDGSRFANNGE